MRNIRAINWHAIVESRHEAKRISFATAIGCGAAWLGKKRIGSTDKMIAECSTYIAPLTGGTGSYS
jgi:hypothetical protein